MTKYQRFIAGMLINIFHAQTRILLNVCEADKREAYEGWTNTIADTISKAVDGLLDENET